ncbi:MAG: M23 family metallopeptidase [Nitrospirae bacterium]|nr:M23 family metallopeptidase [Nitrospirota bacterium]
MLRKFIYRSFTIFAFILVLPHCSSAFNVNIQPTEIFPGGVIFLKLISESPDLPEAAFLGNKIRFYKFKGNEYGALIPVDIETPAGDYSISVKSEGIGIGLKVKIMPYEFAEKKMKLPEEKVTLSSEDSLRVEREFLMQEEIWKGVSDKSWDGAFTPPTDTEVSEEFGVTRLMNEKKVSVHKGIDLKASNGEPVKAINSGKVVLNEDLFYGGNTVIIDHGMGLFSVYMHLSKFNVKAGDAVAKGDVIGFAGMTGRATGPHLHMSVKLQGVSVNPEALMRLEF